MPEESTFEPTQLPEADALRMPWYSPQSVFRSPSQMAAEIRARHINSVTKLTPIAAAANLVNALIVMLTFQNTVSVWLTLPWMLVICLASGGAMLRWARQRTLPFRPASRRAVRRATLHGAMLGLIWSYVPAVLFPGAPPKHQMIAAVVTIGMMSAGAFILAPVPAAALAFYGTIFAGALYALSVSGDPVYYLMLVLLITYSGIVITSALSISRNATSVLLSERAAQHQGRLLGLLLKDFEEQSSNMRWEINARGRLMLANQKLRDFLPAHGPGEDEHLLDWLDQFAAHERDRPSQPLRKAMNLGQAFRDVVVRIHLSDQQRVWWSFSARPLLDEKGRDSGWRGVLTDVTEQQERQARINRLAMFDSLTGLANRFQLRQRLKEAIDQATSNLAPGAALLCIDLDNFKQVNDSMGHSQGDRLLQEAARRLLSVVGPRDVVARMGGDEFAVLLPGCTTADRALDVARRLVQEGSRPYVLQDRQIQAGMSVGVAMIPQHGRHLDEMLANADLALYAAKDAGRGRCELFQPAMGERSRHRLVMAQELRSALGRGELYLVWQPQVKTSQWRIVGAEALLRWAHPQLGSVSPAEFIPLAEETGFIVELGNWVMRTACVEAQRQLPADVSISINVSPAQLQTPDFAQEVRAALEAAGLDPRRLEIEITESLFMDSSPLALRHLHDVRAMGVRVALDDFGTGFSALAYLRKFPFNTLKIDRAFVRELLDGKDARAIVRAIIDMASTLNMQTLAEGVEEPRQLEMLSKARCDIIQGFLVAKPLPMDGLLHLIRHWVDHDEHGDARRAIDTPSTYAQGATLSQLMNEEFQGTEFNDSTFLH